jgi:hypothetical protein
MSTVQRKAKAQRTATVVCLFNLFEKVVFIKKSSIKIYGEESH